MAPNIHGCMCPVRGGDRRAKGAHHPPGKSLRKLEMTHLLWRYDVIIPIKAPARRGESHSRTGALCSPAPSSTNEGIASRNPLRVDCTVPPVIFLTMFHWRQRTTHGCRMSDAEAVYTTRCYRVRKPRTTHGCRMSDAEAVYTTRCYRVRKPRTTHGCRMSDAEAVYTTRCYRVRKPRTTHGCRMSDAEAVTSHGAIEYANAAPHMVTVWVMRSRDITRCYRVRKRRTTHGCRMSLRQKPCTSHGAMMYANPATHTVAVWVM